jgi:hypothetical protein
MSLDFRPGAFSDFFRDETFRDTFTYTNSEPAAVPVPVRPRRLHVFGQHGAACAGPQRHRL